MNALQKAPTSGHVQSFTFACVEREWPMRAHGTINGQPWKYRLDRGRESLAVGGVEIMSHEFPPDVLREADEFQPLLVSDSIEFIVQRLMRWAAVYYNQHR